MDIWVPGRVARDYNTDERSHDPGSFAVEPFSQSGLPAYASPTFARRIVPPQPLAKELLIRYPGTSVS